MNIRAPDGERGRRNNIHARPALPMAYTERRFWLVALAAFSPSRNQREIYVRFVRMPSQERIATKNRKPEHSRPPYLCTPIRSECCRTPVCVCNCFAKQGSLFQLVREMVGTKDKNHSTPQPHLQIALSVYAGGGRGDCLGSLSLLCGLFVVAEGCDDVEALNEADTIFAQTTGKANHGWQGWIYFTGYS